jgi:catechol 2,3-dioxygenase-like lactoylglutathione lyase family enzyme
MILDVFHFSFTVSDIDEASDWLEHVLGLEPVLRQRQDNEYTRELVGIDDAVLEIAQFAIPGIPPLRSTHMLEIVEYVSAGGLGARELPTNDAGVAHLALMVTDVHARYERMRAQGVDFVNPPVQITAGANRGGWSCYLRGPDGITFELMQPSPARLEELGITDEGT